MGDPEREQRDQAFESVVAHYEALLLRYVARLLCNSEAVEDVVQNTFIRLHRAWRDAFEPSAQIASWLYRVAHNLAIDHMRREERRGTAHQRQAADEQAREDETPAPVTRAHDPAELTRMALDLLDERERQIVILKVYEEKSYREISTITGVGEGNVGYILHHAMKKLAKAVTERMGQP